MSRVPALTVSLLTVALVASGCAEAYDVDSTEASVALPAGDGALVLDLVNYPGTTASVLDVDIGLDSRAVGGIIAQRDGADGVALTPDDRLFADIAALDAVPYVGDVAFGKLLDYAHAHPAPTAETVRGTLFRGWESEAVVWGVNHTIVEELDVAVALDVRAAENLVAGRPFASVTAMSALPYVGVRSVNFLHAYADVWWAAMHDPSSTPALGGTFDGVAFDDATATIALDIANGATTAQLTLHGMTASPAAAILAARPFTSVQAIAAVSGVGTATMTALRGFALSGEWATLPVDCVGSFEDAVTPHLAGMLFMSESDRPLDVVSFLGAGTSAPTAASVLALAGAPAGSTSLLRSADNYYLNLEGTPEQVAAVQAAFLTLTDVVYVAVIPSNDPVSVKAYLVGRTSCGDLVGLVAIAIET